MTPSDIAMFHGGPFDGEKPDPLTDPLPDLIERQGEERGVWGMFRYEHAGGGEYEYAGFREMTDIANEAAGADAEIEGYLVDLDKMTAAEALEFLIEDSDRRCAEILDATGGAVDISEMFDAHFIRIFLDHLVRHTSSKLYEQARLDFENVRSLKIDEVEDKYNEQSEQRRAQFTRATLAGQVPAGAQLGPEIAMPNRRIRRANRG